ncbi:MAG: tRNA uracil 4-sulfurtransferase [Thermoleophilaceae bacterium]|jgi:thiamine biosynthesis protein ThiI|nr:tRNA uracil 4-sulfurtransferase [Thermoleophilaceae bacterium]
MDRSRQCVLLKFGELALKGRNRPRFVRALERNLRRATADLGPLEVRHRGGVFILSGDMPQQELVERCLRLPGVSVVQPALRCERDATVAADAAVELLHDRPGRTFAVRATRRDKRFALRSIELARLLGDVVRVRLGLDVDLSDPDLELFVEVDHKELLVSVDRLRGAGGLPVGTSGRALVLLSGGLDSPVAAYRMMKRGLRCDFIHFSGRPFTSPESIYKAYALVGELDRFQGDSRLYVVTFGPAQRRLATAGAGRLQVLSQRRLMVRVASALGERLGADALVTGDSLGQVASQTLPNLAVVEEAAQLPLLRPLIDRDKSEIVDAARALGTYDISILPDEDCCQLFSSKLASTRGHPDDLRRIERTADVEELVEQLAESAELFHPTLEDRAMASAATLDSKRADA